MNYVSADVFRAIGDHVDNVVLSQARVVVDSDVIDSLFPDGPPESQLELIDYIDEMNHLDQWVAFEFGEEWCLMGIRVHRSAEQLLDHVNDFGKID